MHSAVGRYFFQSQLTLRILVVLFFLLSCFPAIANEPSLKRGGFLIDLMDGKDQPPVVLVSENLKAKVSDDVVLDLTGKSIEAAKNQIHSVLENSYRIKSIDFLDRSSFSEVTVFGDVFNPGKYSVPEGLFLSDLSSHYPLFDVSEFEANFSVIRNGESFLVSANESNDWEVMAGDAVLITLSERLGDIGEKIDNRKKESLIDSELVDVLEKSLAATRLQEKKLAPNDKMLKKKVEPSVAIDKDKEVLGFDGLTDVTKKNLIQSGDTLIINFPEESGFDQEFLIDRYGNIILPEVGEINVSGLDLAEVKIKIKEELSVFFLGLENIDIYLKDKKILVTVLGYVEKPGEVVLPSTGNIQMAINQAGGFKEGAMLNNIKLKRDGKDYVINFHRYLNSGNEKYLPVIQSLDTIFVPSSPELGTIYGKKAEDASIDPTQDKSAIKVIGEVIKPGSLAFKESMTAVDALLLAGGVTRYADDTKIRVINEGKPSSFNLAEFMEFGDAGEKVYLSKGATIYVPIKDDTAVLADDPTDNPDSIKVFGEVIKPGVHKFKENISLVDILLLSGGVTRYANVEQIRLIAKGDPILFNLKSFLDNGKALPIIEPGSTIFVPKQVDAISSGESVVYIMGQVHKPGAFETGDGINFMDVLANAGGPTRFADTTSIRLLRKNGEVLRFNLDEFSEGRVTEIPDIFKGDSILVPKKSGEDQGWLKFKSDQTIKIVGAVNKPGRYPWSSNIGFMDLFAHVGGANEKSDIAHIKFIYPSENGDAKIKTFNLQDYIRKGPKASQIPELVGGLTIVVPELPRSPVDNKSQWIMQASEQSIYIIGEINSPGRYAFNDELGFIDLLTAADGPTEDADLSSVRIVHRNGNKNQVRIYDLREYFVSGDPSNLPEVKPGDSIYISSRDGSLMGKDQTITVLGEVMKNGRFSYTRNMTIVDVISQAGGTKTSADITKVVIRRKGSDNQVYDLEELLEEPNPEKIPPVLPGDIVYVSHLRADEDWLKFTSDQTVKIVGAIREPGRYTWSPDINFMDLFAHAGGPNEKSDIAHIKIVYPTANGESEIKTFNLQDFIRDGSKDSELPEIYGGVTVVVPELPRSPVDNKSQWIMQPSENSIYIIGEVNEPGRYAFNEKLSFMDILSAADGPTNKADLSNVRVVHRYKDKKRSRVYDLRQYFLSGDEDDLPKVKPGDSIYISSLDASLMGKIHSVSVLGEVKKNGSYSYTKDMTILDLLSRAGGTNDTADIEKIIVRREEGDQVIFDLEAYMEHPKLNQMPQLLPGDIVYVSHLRDSWATVGWNFLKDITQVIPLFILLGF